MKSGLEGRNNDTYWDRSQIIDFIVSMKSGLEGRNNLFGVPWLWRKAKSQ